MAYQYARGYAPVNRIAVMETASRFPRRLQAIVRLFLIEGCFRANWEDGLNPNGRDSLYLKRGEYPMGREEMAETLDISVKKLRNIIKALTNLGVIAQKTANRGTIISIVDFDTYCTHVPEKGQQRASKGPAKGHSEEVQEVQEVQELHPPTTLLKPRQQKSPSTKKPDPEPSEDAQRAAQRWFELRPFDEKHRPTYWRVFDDMYRLDHVEWNSSVGIHAIVEHALTVWQSAHIQAPSKLRLRSKAYPEKKTWEVIRDQILHPMVASVPGRETVKQRLARRQAEREAKARSDGTEAH